MYTHANICIQISFSILLFASCFLPHSQRTMSLANYKTTPINILGVNYSSITLPKRVNLVWPMKWTPSLYQTIIFHLWSFKNSLLPNGSTRSCSWNCMLLFKILNRNKTPNGNIQCNYWSNFFLHLIYHYTSDLLFKCKTI